MRTRSLVRSVLLLLCGVVIGAVVMQWRYSVAAQAPAQSAAGAPPAIDLKALDADVTRLKALLPSNSTS
jgi:hypothetical protein